MDRPEQTTPARTRALAWLFFMAALALLVVVRFATAAPGPGSRLPASLLLR